METVTTDYNKRLNWPVNNNNNSSQAKSFSMTDSPSLVHRQESSPNESDHINNIVSINDRQKQSYNLNS